MATFPRTFCVVADEIIPHCFLLEIDYLSLHNICIDSGSGQCIQSFGGRTKRVNIIPTVRLPSFSVNVSGAQEEQVEELSAPKDSVEVECLLTSLLDITDLRVLHQLEPLRGLHQMIEASIPVVDWPEDLHSFKSAAKKLQLKEDILWYKGKELVPVVSHDLLAEVALSAHRNMAHIGRDKLVHLLQRHQWHPKLYSVSRDVCVSCEQCQWMKVARQSVAPPTLKIKTTSPFELTSVDLVQFSKSRDGYVGCCVMVDHYSKWLAAVPIKDKRSSTIAFALEHLMLPFLPRLPSRMLSDNGPEFIGAEFENMLIRYNIKHTYTTPYKPSSNGCVERVNHTLGELLRNIDVPDWRIGLTKAVVVYNNTRHRELNASPSEYLLGRKHTTNGVILMGESDVLQKWKQGHPRFMPFEINQTVMKKIPMRGHAVTTKFKPRYEGPFTVC